MRSSHTPCHVRIVRVGVGVGVRARARARARARVRVRVRVRARVRVRVRVRVGVRVRFAVVVRRTASPESRQAETTAAMPITAECEPLASCATCGARGDGLGVTRVRGYGLRVTGLRVTGDG